LREVERFFLDYKMLEDKKVQIEGLQGPDKALAALRAAVALYDKERDSLRRT
jgi:inorganic pyrophosphatase